MLNRSRTVPQGWRMMADIIIVAIESDAAERASLFIQTDGNVVSFTTEAELKRFYVFLPYTVNSTKLYPEQRH